MVGKVLAVIQHSGAVMGLVWCALAVAVLAAIGYVRRVRRERAERDEVIRAQLAELKDLRSGLQVAAMENADLFTKYQDALTPRQPPSQPNEFVPGLQAAMQSAVDGSKLGTVLTVGERGEQAAIDGVEASAGISVRDYRPTDELPPNVMRNPHAVPAAAPDTVELQERRNRYHATPHRMGRSELESRIGLFSDRRNAVAAQIREEAFQEAIAALPEAKRAALWAEGGEPAVRQYVAAAVDEALALIGEGTKDMVASLTASKSGETPDANMRRLKQGLDLTRLPEPVGT